jgi:hypothetical protein
MTRSSRWITSLGSILDIFLCHKTYPSLASSFDFMFRDIDGTPIDEWRSTSLLLQTARAGFHLLVWSRIVVGGASWLEIICRSAARRNRLLEQVDRDYNVRNIVRFKLDAFAEYVESFLPMPKFKLKSQLLLLVKVLGGLSLVPSSPPRLLPSDILVRSSLHSSFLRRSFSPLSFLQYSFNVEQQEYHQYRYTPYYLSPSSSAQPCSIQRMLDAIAISLVFVQLVLVRFLRRAVRCFSSSSLKSRAPNKPAFRCHTSIVRSFAAQLD